MRTIKNSFFIYFYIFQFNKINFYNIYQIKKRTLFLTNIKYIESYPL